MISIKSFTFNAYQENTYILYDETKSCVIIDPGMYTGEDENEILRFMAHEKLTPVLLLNTHCHIDHVLGNKWVYDTYGLLPQFNEGELPTLTAIPGYAPSMGFQYNVSPLPEVFLPESGTVSFGISELELLYTPGHSPAHLCFYSKADNFVIGGDVLFRGSIGRYDLPGGDVKVLFNSIKTKLLPLPDDCTVYPGHGPSTTIGYEKATNPYLN